MRIALRELARRPGHFAFVGGAITLLSILLLLLGGLLDGLFLGATGAIRAQDAQVFVYSSQAQESFLRSRIPPELRAEIEATPGVTSTAGLSLALDAGRLEGSDELLDVALLGYERSTGVLPAPPNPGEAWADDSLASKGVEQGDVLVVGTGEVPVRIAGFVDDTDYLLQSSLWVEPTTWREVQAASRPDAAVGAGVVQVLLTDGEGDDAALAADIDRATGGATTSLTRPEAVLSLPGTQEQNATFNALLGTTFFVVGLITALFFVLLTIERTSLYAAMKALGASSGSLAVWSTLQAVVVSAISFGVAALASFAIAGALAGQIPLQLEVSRAISTAVIVVITAAVGSLIPLRRIVRVDPADAIS